MNWKISDLIRATIASEVELAVTKGELDRLVLQKLRRVTKDRRYRAKKAAQNVRRVQAVAEELQREWGVRRLGRDAGWADHDYSSRF